MAVAAAKVVRARLATISVARASVRIRTVFSCYLIGLSRNKELQKDGFSILILEFALVEATALFALLMTFLILFAF